MPSGCNFICKNHECEHNDKSITLTSPWPMADIDLIIEVTNNENFVSLKKEGRKFGCLILPNNKNHNLPIEAYRVEKFCSYCYCIVPFEVKNDLIQEKTESKDTCPRCLKFLMNFTEVFEAGIQCSFCDQFMEKEFWHSNEEE